MTFVTPEYFDVLGGVRVIAGQALAWQDDESARAVAVVNQSFVRRFSTDRDPLGRREYSRRPRDDHRRRSAGSHARRRAGLAAGRRVQPRCCSFVPSTFRLMARGRGDPLALVASLREAVRRVDPDVPLQEIVTLHEAVYRDKRVLDVLSSLFLVFGVGALSLTAVALYGIVSFTVAQRARETGIRLALGATRVQVLRLVMGQGSRQIVIGLVVGVLLPIALSRGFAAAVEQTRARRRSAAGRYRAESRPDRARGDGRSRAPRGAVGDRPRDQSGVITRPISSLSCTS